jgi:hypothetical protein
LSANPKFKYNGKSDCTDCSGLGKYYDSYWDDWFNCPCVSSEVYKKAPKCELCNNIGYAYNYTEKIACSCKAGGVWEQKQKELNKKPKKNPILLAKAQEWVDWTPPFASSGKAINVIDVDNLNVDKVVAIDFGKVELKYLADLSNAEEQLKKKPGNNEIVYPKKNQLQLDYDQEDVPEQFTKMIPVLRQRFPSGTIKWEKYKSSSKVHIHVVVDLPEDINDNERILWQAVFGSDCMREGINILRMAAHLDNPSLLFMPVDRQPIESGIIPERLGRRFKELDAT